MSDEILKIDTEHLGDAIQHRFLKISLRIEMAIPVIVHPDDDNEQQLDKLYSFYNEGSHCISNETRQLAYEVAKQIQFPAICDCYRTILVPLHFMTKKEVENYCANTGTIFNFEKWEWED